MRASWPRRPLSTPHGYGHRMRVAALYDIHGNVPALESALADVASAGVDAILIGGDVAEGPQPMETLDLLESIDIPLRWLRGNCDRKPSEWVTERLDEQRVAWLTMLPPTDRMNVSGLGPVLFCHGSPRSDEDIVTAVSDPDRVAPMLAGVDEAVVVSGHTHVQFDRSVAGHRLINAGSIGMPYQGVRSRATAPSTPTPLPRPCARPAIPTLSGSRSRRRRPPPRSTRRWRASKPRIPRTHVAGRSASVAALAGERRPGGLDPVLETGRTEVCIDGSGRVQVVPGVTSSTVADGLFGGPEVGVGCSGHVVEQGQ